MIVFDLSCDSGHRFEGWFGSSADFAEQSARGLLACPECGSGDIGKVPMAPAVSTKSNRRTEIVARARRQRPGEGQNTAAVTSGPLPPEVTKAIAALAKAQTEALKGSTWVGDKFAEKSRAIHYGEADQATIHGQATLQEAKALVEEGIAVTPLPFQTLPPEDLN